jgi:hypothetical protein
MSMQSLTRVREFIIKRLSTDFLYYEKLCLKYVLVPPLAILILQRIRMTTMSLRNENQPYFLTEKRDMVPTVGPSTNQFSSSAPYLR